MNSLTSSNQQKKEKQKSWKNLIDTEDCIVCTFLFLQPKELISIKFSCKKLNSYFYSNKEIFNNIFHQFENLLSVKEEQIEFLKKENTRLQERNKKDGVFFMEKKDWDIINPDIPYDEEEMKNATIQPKEIYKKSIEKMKKMREESNKTRNLSKDKKIKRLAELLPKEKLNQFSKLDNSVGILSKEALKLK